MMADLWKILRLRLRLFWHSRLAAGFYLAALLLFLAGLGGLLYQAEERSSIPAGLVCLEESELAERLVNRLQDNPSFYFYQTGEAEAKKLLAEGKVEIIFRIEAGYEKAVREGKKHDLITVIYPEGDSTNRILSDIAAGEVLRDVCMADSYNLYRQTMEAGQSEGVSEEEYQKRAEALSADGSLAMDFQYDYVGREGAAEYAGNKLLYGQVILCLLLGLLAFTAFLAGGTEVSENLSETGLRRKVIPHSFLGEIVGDTVFLYLLTGLTGLLCWSVLFSIAGNGMAISCLQGLIVIQGGAVFLSAVYAAASRCFHKESWYQIAGLFFFTLFFIKIFFGGWFISQLTDILF